jgi:hypothetical protein
LDAPTAESGAPTPPKQPGAPRRWFFVALPFVITALAAVAVSLLLQLMFFRPSPTVLSPPTASASTPAPSLPTSAGAAPTARPIAAAPTALPLAQGISEQELADIRAEGDRKQAQIYLLLAIVQIDDAENALRSNELASVDQSLVAIDNSLNLAYARYERAGDSARDAVAQRRMEIGKLHDDLYLYPEGMDQRLNTLRQLTLALITEQQR